MIDLGMKIRISASQPYGSATIPFDREDTSCASSTKAPRINRSRPSFDACSRPFIERSRNLLAA